MEDRDKEQPMTPIRAQYTATFRPESSLHDPLVDQSTPHFPTSHSISDIHIMAFLRLFKLTFTRNTVLWTNLF